MTIGSKEQEEPDIEQTSRQRLIDMHTREEKREVFMMVAKKYLGSFGTYNCMSEEWLPDDYTIGAVECEAEEIYQAMLEFCGEIK